MYLDRTLDVCFQNGTTEPLYVSRLNPDFRVQAKRRGRDGLEVRLLEYEFQLYGRNARFLLCRCDGGCTNATVFSLTDGKSQEPPVNDWDVSVLPESAEKNRGIQPG